MGEIKVGKKSIAARWFVNSFIIIAALLLIVDIAVYFIVKSYYYSAAEQFMKSEANVVSGVLTRFYDNSSGSTADVRQVIEEFDKKNSMELMAIAKSGRVGISSSGFSPASEYDMPDYDAAKTAEDGIGTYVGYLGQNAANEKYMAVTVMLDDSAGAYGAIRVMSSLSKVDVQIFSILFWVAAVSIGVLLLVLLLGLYFVKSIVLPIRQIGFSARKLAKGDFTGRIMPQRDDEVGELCRVFNYMADELENSETIKNEFISSVSHELRTPLTAIKGWSETIMEMKDQDTLVKGMRVITAETERLSEMVEELLDFSRIQNNSLLLQKTNMDILAELADALLIYDERARHAGIQVNYTEPDAVAMIYGDKNRIRQVFINIIDNAIKYSGDNAVINVEAELADNKIRIKIQDNGCGISAADLPKVKTRFYKANNTVRGSGIGLAVADEIIQLHEGSLDIESEQGAGTTVIITLPTIQKKAEPAENGKDSNE